MDKAVIDRLYTINFPQPNIDVLVKIIELKCDKLKLDPHPLIDIVKNDAQSFHSVRQIERLVMEAYVESLI